MFCGLAHGSLFGSLLAAKLLQSLCACVCVWHRPERELMAVPKAKVITVMKCVWLCIVSYAITQLQCYLCQITSITTCNTPARTHTSRHTQHIEPSSGLVDIGLA